MNMTLANSRNLDVIGTSDAAKILEVPTRTLIWRASQGHIPFIQKLPGRNGAYLFDRETVEALAKDGAK